MYLGIDLGTSNSAIVANIDNELRIFKSVEKGTDVLPSVIYIDRRGHKFYGHRAYEHLFKNPNNAVDGFKRQMGTAWKKEFADSGVVMNAEECSAEILRQLLEQAKMACGGREISGAVITTPAAFNTMQIEATHRAAEMAGLKKIALVQEPVAAAMAAVAKSKNKDGLFLVYDIGGGTFDLALAQSIKGNINILAHEGINALGGRDFDRIIVNSVIRPWLLENYSLPTDFQKNPKYAKIVRIARLAAEIAKIELSKSESAKVYLSEDDIHVTDDDGNDIYIEIPITRKSFEELIADKVDETVSLSRKILKDNGYEASDIDRLVFVGGPSNMPILRNKIPHELGLPADIDVDPMIVVAQGAAIFCEGLDWSGTTTSRKTSRETAESGGEINLRYDYTNRTADDRTRIRIKPQDTNTANGVEIQIDSSEGWTSGRRELKNGVTVELPLDKMGDNFFRVQVFDKKGGLAADAGKEVVITKTAATAGALPLAHNLATVIVEGEGDERENTLHIFAEKGTTLPAHGVMPNYRASRDVRASDKPFTVQFFEIPDKQNMTPGEPNLFIGSCEALREDIASDIRTGDEIKIHWEVNESQLIKLGIELPSGDIMDGKFYSSKLGEKHYDGKGGENLVKGFLTDAEKEMSDAKEIASPDDAPHLRKLTNSLEEQRQNLENAEEDGEERRSIAEKIRSVRQEIAKVRNNPQNKVANLAAEVQDIEEDFNQYCRENTDAETCKNFDNRAQQARAELKNGESGYEDAKRHVKEMRNITQRAQLDSPAFIASFFKHLTESGHSAIDAQEHDRLVEEGMKMLENNDFDGLRRVVFELFSNQVNTGGSGPDISKFSDIMRK